MWKVGSTWNTMDYTVFIVYGVLYLDLSKHPVNDYDGISRLIRLGNSHR